MSIIIFISVILVLFVLLIFVHIQKNKLVSSNIHTKGHVAKK